MKGTWGKSAQEALIPAGWLKPKRRKRIEKISSWGPDKILDSKLNGWHPGYRVVPVSCVEEHDALMGYEIAHQIHSHSLLGDYIIIILPVGPMGQYRYVTYWLKKWDTDLRRTFSFNMDEWGDKKGNPVVVGETFAQAMGRELFGPLGGAIPSNHINFATKDNLPTYAEKFQGIRLSAKRQGLKCFVLLVHGIGQGCHIAFWEPHMAAIFPHTEKWLAQTHFIGVPLCAMTLEQNAITSASSNIFGIPAYANTIGPGIYMQADYVVGGCDGALTQSGNQRFSMTWQAQAVHMSLAWGSDDPGVPSAWIPRKLSGVLFVVDHLLKPLTAISH